MDATDVVTAFLLHDDRILLLRRSEKVGSYRGRWAGVSGYVERDPLEQAYVEIEEETGLGRRDLDLIRAGEPLLVHDRANDRLWRVHPFLFAVDDPERIRLDWEHVQRRWVWPGEIEDLDTVPGLAKALQRVRP